MCTAFLTVLLLIGIFLFLFLSSLRAFREITPSEFLLGNSWNPVSYHRASWGIGSLLQGTLLVSTTALLFAAPLGLFTAIYLSEIARPLVREILKPTIEMIAGIPSVVLGLLGLLFFAPLIAKTFHLSNGLNALTAGILVGIAALPTIASVCEDALSGVTRRYREASLALGATRWATIRRVVLPAAHHGIAAAIMLGLGRIIGETMIVLMVAGNSLAPPRSLFSPARPITATIAIEIKETIIGSTHWHSLFALGLILFLLTFLVNFVADFLIHRRTL
ncbi:phosphate ABC transporter permease subunit PstC [Candidatus Peribacteria bacterium RIFCSPLOWO2_12_FULL_55_15]|nr:MAG: phosphate ABC transporter permease subunit PstC [Candidatus Peribacteria bacterium RIFCSPHIGHO2_01_FULL_54_22]OGJ62487.1 MAG: phosphate ABC transporter permease subunit PstC [Candidatus Peribacteria bacterium RIFCSPHIGHO2_02_FULL_55_24]OGJ64064.1 MAG: phosphate ABC transporter permease subunit PstC [Candidatus Peribacteria bacterium RIFCSPHIGHO2_12_FULL_54_10]OGJ67534.1 MAG: phosphate ABC transporter permease subunit PstC [Candidatus Peribacteria bacterium RIFCSPLOWO2_01_FULL_54_110]OGJ